MPEAAKMVISVLSLKGDMIYCIFIRNNDLLRRFLPITYKVPINNKLRTTIIHQMPRAYDLIIFTDLDATLLDYNGYGFSGAEEALRYIRNRGIPLILVTSKSLPEVESIQTELDIDDPFIVENGAALFVKNGYRKLDFTGEMVTDKYSLVLWGTTYSRIRTAMVEARNSFPIKGFSDMSPDEVEKRTGLSREKASLARKRDYSEPFLLTDQRQLPALKAWAATRGLAVIRGGRFLHLVGAGQDKGRAVSYLTEAFKRSYGGPLLTMGLGDSPNDAPMLAAVDIPVLLPQENGEVADIHLPGLTIGALPGSRGWNEQVLKQLERMDKTTARR